MLRRRLFVALLLPLATLSWGYWHQSTHAALNVSLSGISTLEAEVELLDSANQPLARGNASKPHGTIWIAHPQVGDCTLPGRTDWSACFQTTARWIPSWVRRVRAATVTLPACRIERIPVTVTESGDEWWLWWVPLPHIGGKPYGYFTISIPIEPARCTQPSQPLHPARREKEQPAGG